MKELESNTQAETPSSVFKNIFFLDCDSGICSPEIMTKHLTVSF